MNEKTERYRAISQVAELLRETTAKRPVFNEGSIPQFEYYNTVFDEQEHNDLKRALLRMCSDV